MVGWNSTSNPEAGERNLDEGGGCWERQHRKRPLVPDHSHLISATATRTHFIPLYTMRTNKARPLSPPAANYRPSCSRFTHLRIPWSFADSPTHRSPGGSGGHTPVLELARRILNRVHMPERVHRTSGSRTSKHRQQPDDTRPILSLRYTPST